MNNPNDDAVNKDSNRGELLQTKYPSTTLAGDIEKTQDDLYATINRPITTTGPGKN